MKKDTKVGTVNNFALGIQDIKKRIPHRYPFLMVDRVINVMEKQPGEVVGRVCLAQKNVTGNEPFFEGHFPDAPVMPGVLILEAIAQAGALCCCAVKGDPPIERLFFAGLDNVRFKAPVFPGDVLDLKVEMKKRKSSFFWGEGVASVGGKVSVYADLLAHITFKK
ncbi:MAG: beta-hydroxyacyl-ACP dehydratase [Oligoflexia bacterium]|nr:beta-hydroxyacyl-ACP dehydratase [Oligoflexia bacterium]